MRPTRPAARVNSIRAGRGDRRARRARRRDHRSGASAGQCWVLAGFGAFRCARRVVRDPGTSRAAADASALVVHPPPVRADRARRLLVNIAFYGLIFVVQPVLPAGHGLSSFATGACFVPMMAAVLPVNSSRRASPSDMARRQPSPPARDRGRGLRRVARHRRGTSYWAICASFRARRGLGLIVRAEPRLARQRGEVALGPCGRRPQLRAADRQRAWRGAVRLADRPDRFISVRRQGALIVSALLLTTRRRPSRSARGKKKKSNQPLCQASVTLRCERSEPRRATAPKSAVADLGT